jgi:hypothetical protein
MSAPWLSDAELAEMCAPLQQPAAQIRWLKRAGYHVERRPNGKPLLMRSELERVAGAARFGAPAQNAPGGQPDRAALLQVIAGGKRGPKAQGR